MAKISKIKNLWCLGYKFQNFFLSKERKIYNNFFSEAIPNDEETLEFVKKITNEKKIIFKPLESLNKNEQDTVGIIIAASGYEKRWPISNYIQIIDYLTTKSFKKFLIISGLDQSNNEEQIKNFFIKKRDVEIIFTSQKKIVHVIPLLKKCIFCIGNDTGFSHLSINYGLNTFIIYGDCPPQYYSDKIIQIDIPENIKRSKNCISSIEINDVLFKVKNFLDIRGGRVV